MSSLAGERCVQELDQDARLNPHNIRQYERELPPGWNTIENHHLHRNFSFDDFATALEFVNQIGAIAENENHHPDIGLSYGQVNVELLTHKVGGLTRNDFILAAKISSAAPKVLSG